MTDIPSRAGPRRVLRRLLRRGHRDGHHRRRRRGRPRLAFDAGRRRQRPRPAYCRHRRSRARRLAPGPDQHRCGSSSAALLLTFGLQWLTKGVVRRGRRRLHRRGRGRGGRRGYATARTASSTGRPGCWPSRASSSRGSRSPSSSSPSAPGRAVARADYLPAYIGAGAAFVIFGTMGVLAKRRASSRSPAACSSSASEAYSPRSGHSGRWKGSESTWPGEKLSQPGRPLCRFISALTFALAGLARRGDFSDPSPAATTGAAARRTPSTESGNGER